jgi:hypothetical protein
MATDLGVCCMLIWDLLKCLVMVPPALNLGAQLKVFVGLWLFSQAWLFFLGSGVCWCCCASFACLFDQGVELLKDQSLLVVETDLPLLHPVESSINIGLKSFKLTAHSV